MSKISPRVKIKTNTQEHKVLSFLKTFGELSMDVFFPEKYPQAAIWRDFFKDDSEKETSNKKINSSVSKTLIRLKEKGLVSKNGSTRQAIWHISDKGKTVLNFINISTIPEKDGRTRIIVFDIPETKKHYRNWFRNELIGHDFKMLQRSVWIGQRPLSQDVLEHVATDGIFDDIHIFEVKESGTLKDIDWGR